MDYSGESYETVHFLVHPGWAPRNMEIDWEKPERKQIFLQEFYQDYIRDLQNLTQELGEDEALHVIYDEGGKTHAETILDQLSEYEPEAYTQSKDYSGTISEGKFGEIQDTLEKLDENGEIMVHGEIRGRCDELFIRQLEQEIPEEKISTGETFPPKPTWNYAFETG